MTSRAVQLRRGTTSEMAGFTGREGELVYDRTKKTPVIHDGLTAGGFALMRSTVGGGSLVNGVGITILRKITPEEYDSLAVKDSQTLYVIVENAIPTLPLIAAIAIQPITIS